MKAAAAAKVRSVCCIYHWIWIFKSATFNANPCRLIFLWLVGGVARSGRRQSSCIRVTSAVIGPTFNQPTRRLTRALVAETPRHFWLIGSGVCDKYHLNSQRVRPQRRSRRSCVQNSDGCHGNCSDAFTSNLDWQTLMSCALPLFVGICTYSWRLERLTVSESCC